MTTLHIANKVRDYDGWKAAFDEYEQFRIDNGVREYRVTQSVQDPSDVRVDLDFDDRPTAEAFAERLQQVWATPRSRALLVAKPEPVLLERVGGQVLRSIAG